MMSTETARLRMRGWRASDFPVFARYYSNEDGQAIGRKT